MAGGLVIETFDSRALASAAAAEALEQAIRADLQARGQASLAVSGGSSPVACFERLASRPLDWEHVQVTLTDERQVPVTDPDSNEGMLRRHLLLQHGAAACFVPLQAAAIQAMPATFSAVLCGMGADGHFASLFPDVDNLDWLLDPDNPELCAAVRTAASPHPRMTLTLARMLRSRLLLLLVFGDDKRRVLDAPQGLPVAHLLSQQAAPMRVLWAP